MSQSEEVHVFATLVAQAGKEAELRAVLSGLVAPTREEPGCLHYMLHEDPQAPANFYFFEAYKNQDAVNAHMKSPHLAAALGKAGELLAAKPVIDSTRLVAGG